MGDVVVLPVITTLDCPPERILSEAIDADLEYAVVIGWTKDGNLYFGSSKAACPEVLWLMRLAEKRLLEIGDGK